MTETVIRKSTHTAIVVPLIRKPHDNADSLSIVSIDETYQVVIRTADWEGETKAVYIPPQNIVDTEIPEFAWLKTPGSDRFIVTKPVKLRGQWSYGFLVKCPEWANVGDDLTEHFKLRH